MSAVKFDQPTYKLFEPQYHPQRPIIVDADDGLESPETVTLRYEEDAAARANGGDLRGESPPGLLSMSTYAKQLPQMQGFDSSRSYQDPSYPYPGQHHHQQHQHHQFSNQPAENAAAQLNQMAFAANGAAASGYMTGPPPPVMPTLMSVHPSSGVFGTKVMIKISSSYDVLSVTSQFFIEFGAYKCAAHAARDTSDASGLVCIVSADAPRLEDTRSHGASVPLALLVDSAEGHNIATMDVGTFTYHDGAVGAVGSPTDAITRRESTSPEQQRHSPPKHQQQQHQHQQQHQQQQQQQHDAAVAAAASIGAEHQMPEPATNTFGYPGVGSQAVPSSYDPSFSANGTNMMSTGYHRPSYGGDYPAPHQHQHQHQHRAPPPPPLKGPSWSPYSSLSSSHRSSIHHTATTRPSLTTLPVPPSGNPPQLIRTSTIQSSGGSAGGLNPYQVYSTKAVLKIQGDLNSMASGWSHEEICNRRRIVMFSKKQAGSVLTAQFTPVPVNERPPNSICISCIYWVEKDECYVTSVDTISLLEQLVAAPTNRFTVEEKNRIRRNLEGFRPATVSKAKQDSEDFFKIIMGFPNPKPRNIEKDVKVFPWKILAPALKKIIGKYSANPSSTMQSGPSPGPTLLTPVSNPSPGLYTPQTPTLPENPYSHPQDPHTMASPRSFSGPSSATANWNTYPSSRTLSPTIKTQHSPQSAGGIKIPSMPPFGSTDMRQHHHSSHSSAYHHPLGAPAPGPPQPTARWDAPVSTNGYADPTGIPAYSSHHHPGHTPHVYSNGGYDVGGHRD